MARTVEDVLARRTRALTLNARASIEAAPMVARLLAAELGRDSAWIQAQIHDFAALARGHVYSDPASLAGNTASPSDGSNSQADGWRTGAAARSFAKQTTNTP
jgi:glycerol-3-phosphate dehydrogenase